MAAFNGVRVLPDMPNMEILIQEFETGFRLSSCQNNVSESSTFSGGSFVKKIVEAYESNVKSSTENIEQQKHVSKKCGFFNRNQKNIEKSDLNSSIYGEFGNSLRRWTTNLKNRSEIFSVVKKHEDDLEDDLAMSNQYLSKSNKKTWSGISSKTNKCGFMKELTNIRHDSSKKNEIETLKKRDQIFYSPSKNEEEYKSKSNMPLICSSPLKGADDKDTDYDEDPLDDILTNSHNSSNASNNSYKNLQVDLYNFENEEFELSSTSSQSLNSSSRSLCDDRSSTKSHANSSLLLDSSFQEITVISSKNVLNNRENSQTLEQISVESSFDFNRELPRVIGASLKQPIKIDDTPVTWIPILNEKLPRKKSLKKLLSVFNRAKLSLNHRKINKKLKKKQAKKQHIFDSGFIERCPSESSFSSQQSWHSDASHVNDEPSTPPTFRTFGRTKRVNSNGRTFKNLKMLPEILHASKLANNFVPSDPYPWIPSRNVVSLSKENCQNVEFSNTLSSSKSKFFCKYPLLPKHPHLVHSSIPKHPFVARTKMDQMEEMEATAVKTMQRGEKMEQKSMLELRCSSTLPMSIPISQSVSNVSYSRMSERTDSSTNNNYDLSNLYKSTSTLDEIVFRRQASAYDVPRRSWLTSLTTDSSSPISGNNLYEEIVPCMPRFATVSPKNFRFFISQEKSQAIEKSIEH